MSESQAAATDRDSCFIAGIEYAASICEIMEAGSPRKQYQEAAAWLAEAIRERGVRHAQQF